MRRAIACVALTGCSFAPVAALPDAALDAAAPDAPPVPMHLHIEADIDGRSDLILQGTTATWLHYQYAAPGREGFTNFPTTLDAVAWQPTWPDVPNAENRDCACKSSTYSALAVGVPRAPAMVTITATQARRAPTAVQKPTVFNDYTLIVEFDDVGFSGSSTYAIELDVTP